MMAIVCRLRTKILSPTRLPGNVSPPAIAGARPHRGKRVLIREHLSELLVLTSGRFQIEREVHYGQPEAVDHLFHLFEDPLQLSLLPG